MTVLNLISEMKFKEGCVWLDVGCFPGTMGVLLKELLPERSSLYGAGLCFSREFVSKAERVYTGLLEVELDPLNPLAQPLNHKTELELPDNSVDLCFAGEVFEHFYNPLHFIFRSFPCIESRRASCPDNAEFELFWECVPSAEREIGV